jgi:hypothetical protein
MSGVGQSGDRRFGGGGALPPIQVIHRDGGALVTWSVVGTFGLLGLIVAVGFLVTRRS